MRKKLTILFALLCASMMGFAQEPVTGSSTENMAGQGNPFTNGYDYSFSSEGTNVTISFTEKEGYIDLKAYLWNYTNGFAETGMTVSGSTATITLTGQTPGATIRFACKFDYRGGMSVTKEFTYTIPGGDPDPDLDPTPDPDPNSYTAGGHTIHLEAYHVNDIYTLVITSADDMTGLGGSFWYVNGVTTDMRSNSGANSYTVSGDKKTITCQVQSSSAPSIHTPLFVLMPGEVTFSNVTLNWENRTPITSEYCNYQGPETQQDGHYYAITWETDPSGNVVITIGNGTGAGACSFRHGGFEGGNNGLAHFVVSDDDFATTTPAADYFTITPPSDGDLQYVMTKIADLPANAKIKHLSAGAIAWREGSVDRYCYPEFIYTYGGTCNQLDAPTNVAIDETNHITFDAVAGADSYMAYVSLGGVKKYSKAVASGDELTFVPLVSGDYIVNVIASGAGKVDSDPSADYVWHLVAAPVVLGNSEYCEKNMSSGNTAAAFTWETDANGNIVITISEVLNGSNDPAHFRANAFKDGIKVGASKESLSTYFNIPATIDNADHSQKTLTYTLKNPANAPAPGEKIYYNGVVEYRTSENTNAWPTLEFEWTYGTVCSGKSVSASVNNNTMGSAVVKVGDDEVTSVDEGTSVSFIATVTDPTLYSFVNWTKGGVEVSTKATYVTTITETTNLVANFDYIRTTYCHTAIQTSGNKKLYLTVGKGATEGTYQIKIYGSDELTITGINNANTAMNVIKFSTYDGNDVPLNIANKGWEFSDTGYGMITSAEIRPQTGHTWREMWMWRPDLYIGTNAGEQNINSILSQKHHFNWDNECSDTEAPVFDKAEAEVLNESSVRLKIQATDNWGGLLTYTITRAGADDIILKGASGEELTQEITGLTKGTKYTFTVSVTDGVNTATSPSIEVTPVGDEEKPEMIFAWLESKTWNSAIIKVGAKDNKAVKAIRVINADPAIDVEYVAVEGKQTVTKITVTGLTANTAYSFTITAKDAAGNESASKEVVAFTTDAHLLAPTTAAPDPTWPDDQVISFYSDKYTEPTTWNYRAPWGGSTGYEQVVIAENNVIHYSSFDWAGWVISSGNPYNALMMEKLHLDIWVENDCEIGIIPIYGGDGLSTDDTHRVKRALLGQRWNSIDLVLATDYAELNLASIFQFKFDQATTTEFYLDNVYFYRESAIVDDDAPYNVSGNMASQSYFSVTLALSAKDNSGAVTYIIEHGGTQVASTSGASDATVNVKIDNLASGTDYVFSVIAKDERDNAADAIDVNASTLAAPAPAPTPTHVAAAVKSLYSNAYTPVVAVENYSEWWWQSPTVHTNHVLGADDNVLFYDNNHAAGASFGWSWSVDNKIDFSGYQKLHMHIYPTTSGTIEIYPVIAPEGEFHKVSQNLIAGQWNEIVLDYTEKTFAPLNQIGFINFYNLGDFFIDNVYFWKEPDYTRDDSWMAPGELGTVCYQEGLIVTGATMYQMAGTDANGKFVFDEVDVLSPGVPYLFEATANTIQFYATPATPATEAGKSNGMVGTFSEKIIPQNSPNIYYFSGKKFYAVTARQTDLTVPANRAYVDLTTPQPATAPKPGVRRITFDVEGTNTTTGVDQLNASDAPVKTIINGHLFILRGDKMYDATGRMVK